MRVFITGTAGFIGFHLARRLLADGHEVCGLDGMTPYYDVSLKHARHALLARSKAFRGHVAMLEDNSALQDLVAAGKPDVIVHLAAQAGVRYSLENPRVYVDANLVGTFNVMEAAKAAGVRHFLIASTSSVYGANASMPFRETDRTDHPMTLYAATKKATEDMAHSYAHLWKIPTTTFRFFTVYGPWGRPDMAYFSFTRAILAGQPIEVFGEGEMARDFTYVDDIVDGVLGVLDRPPERGGHRILNIGADRPRALMDFIRLIEAACGREAKLVMRRMQPGDVSSTWADVSALKALTGYAPNTTLESGIERFVAWYRGRYRDDGQRRE
jgi:UDP-glucuronate 4-epimerase